MTRQVRPALPGTPRVAEVHLDVSRNGELLVTRKLNAAVPCPRSPQDPGQLTALSGEASNDARCLYP